MLGLSRNIVLNPAYKLGVHLPESSRFVECMRSEMSDERKARYRKKSWNFLRERLGTK